MVSAFTKCHSSHRPSPPIAPANTTVCSAVSSPRGSGRQRVRFMRASIRCSTRQLMAAAEPATSAMPAVAARSRPGGTMPGEASSIPITAVKTMSETTRGLVSARNARTR